MNPNIAAIRSQFPALAGATVYLENAGGSQVPGCVIDAISNYMRESYVQLGAPYDISRESTGVVADAHAFGNLFMGGEGVGQVVLGPSTTQLVTMLAECYSRSLRPGDEIVICETAHEANAGPWERLDRFGMVIKTWPVDPTTCQCSLESLRSLMSDRTKIVAFPHVSNLLGEVVDVKAMTEIAHAAGAQVVVDGVAYAPHRAIDVATWGVDWYVYSTYKVFGPHMAALFGRHDAIRNLEGPNHFFIPNNGDPYKFELGGPSHEACAGLLGLGQYLSFLTGDIGCGRDTVVRAWDVMAGLELPLQEQILRFLRDRDGIRIWGPSHGGASRVATISFTSARATPPAICEATDKANIGIRYGHMYAYRMARKFGLDLEQGVVRVSAVHYNTLQEVDRLLEVLDPLI